MNKSTYDMYFACFLMTQGEPLIDSTIEKGRTSFIFEDTNSFKQLKNEYMTGTPLVNIRSYIENLRLLKSVIHSGL